MDEYERDQERGVNWVIAIIVAIIGVILLNSCGTNTKIAKLQNNEMAKTEVRKETVYIRDSIYIEIPSQSSERTTQDNSSYLENDYAQSIARINPDGSLFHDLRTKPQNKPVPFDKPVERKDSIIYKEKKVEVPVEVEKKLSWWQQTKLDFGEYSIGIIIILISVIFWIVKKKGGVR